MYKNNKMEHPSYSDFSPYQDLIKEELAELKGKPLMTDECDEDAMIDYTTVVVADYMYYIQENMTKKLIFGFQQWFINNYDGFSEYNRIRFVGGD